MKTQLAIVFICMSGAIYGQSVLESDSIRLDRERKEQLFNNYRVSDGQHALDRNSALNETYNKAEYTFDEELKVENLNLYVRKYYEGPMYEYKATSSHNPFADDYNFYKRNMFTGSGSINTQSAHTTYVGLGSLSIIRANYEYMLSDRVIASVGTYGARYFYNMGTHYDFGINGSLTYKVSDRLSLVGFGQYSARGRINNIGGDNAWMMPSTNYGAAAIFKINESVSLQGGVKRELNPMSGKWKNVPFFSPVIKLK